MPVRVSRFLSELTLCAGTPTLKVGGRKCVPDRGKAFVEGFFGYALPNVTCYGQAMLAPTVAKSFTSMEAQVVNIEHLMKSYDPENISRDRIVGSVHAVEYPEEPEGGWQIAADAKAAPGVRVALSIFKAAEGVNRIIGAHQTSRLKFTLSMEVHWSQEESAWCWLKGAKAVPGATDLGSGWEGMAWGDAPADLLACFSDEHNRVVGKWQGRTVVHLLGGLGNGVSFTGMGIVEHGGEPAAKIKSIMASLKVEGLSAEQNAEVLRTCSELQALVDFLAAG